VRQFYAWQAFFPAALVGWSGPEVVRWVNGVIAPERRRLRVAVRRLHPSRVLASLLCWGPPALAKPDILQMILFARSNIFTCSDDQVVETKADCFLGSSALTFPLCPV
jgi:hypothetical protein